MSNITHEEHTKNRFLKALAVGGFIGLIIILAWLGIKLVSFMPNAVTSLASLADSVYNYRAPELVMSTSRSSFATGETTELSWNVPRQAGIFAISYPCLDGVSVDARINQSITTIPCDTTTAIGSVSGIALRVFSERERFVDVPFTVTFTRENGSEPTSSVARTVTVANTAINELVAVEPLPEIPPAPNESDIEPETPPVATSTPTAPRPTPPPQTITTYTYGIPLSNPNGYTDLSASYLTVGPVINQQFHALGYLQKTYPQSAVRFITKNEGTKTSDAWTYIIRLADGTTITSAPQVALKPNERATITHGFATPQTNTSTVTVSVIYTNDNTLSNNSFTAPVAVR